MHYAIHAHTAAELIYERADADKDHMGLTTWKYEVFGCSGVKFDGHTVDVNPSTGVKCKSCATCASCTSALVVSVVES